mmetsp:Transcript_59689/g.117099  ORF Transcript_59689/g.117099 Transcript_59689/m.117099 type:complete len:189 (+) Transcript_59689:78-644(+)
MGQGASVPDSLSKLPETVDQPTALAYLGDCFDEADFAALSQSSGGRVSRAAFKETIDARNFAPSLRSWLEMWRVDPSIVPALETFGVVSPADIHCLEQAEIDSLGLKPIKLRQFSKAMAHAKYLQEVGLSMPLSPLGSRRAGGLKDEDRMTQSMKFPAAAGAADTWGLQGEGKQDKGGDDALEVQPRK